MDQVDTIAAIATPLGIGGIGVVRISGPAALSMAQRMFVRSSGVPCTSLKSHRVYHGFVVNNAGERVDEVLLCCMRRPRSYTREDVAEISCHGGVMTTQRVLEAVLEQGARVAEPGEFTKRAFLNGRLDLTQAEAVIDVINVLAQLAVTCPIAFLLLRRSQAFQLGAGLTLLAAHTLAYMAFGNPWTVGENLGEVLDRAIFGKNWGGHYATINCISSAFNTVLGVIAGGLIRERAFPKLARLGGACLALGLLLSFWVPVIKKIWTASFALVSGGITILALLLFWWLCETKGRKMKLFVMVGANSIFIYLFHEILEDWLYRTAKVFTGWGTSYWPAELLAFNHLVAVIFQIWVCVWLYRRKIFFKL